MNEHRKFHCLSKLPVRSALFVVHILSFIGFVHSVTGIGAETPAPANPLIHRPHESREMCHIWTRNTPRDLCARNRWSRLRLMRELSLFSRDCDDEGDTVRLGDFFRLEWRSIKSEADLIEQSEHLRDGTAGRSCVLGAADSDECLRCFDRLGDALANVNEAYDALSRVLFRFDCGLAVDSASATRPFSPNGTCHDCKKWYRKWSLVHLVRVWKESPCINWCYYAQLACPHLATIRVVDFGGHPTFLCRDLDIPQQRREWEQNKDGVSSCDCVHPCDMTHSSEHRPKTTQIAGFDFFAADEHCAQRHNRCRSHRRRKAEHKKHRRHPDQTNIAKSQSVPFTKIFFFLGMR